MKTKERSLNIGEIAKTAVKYREHLNAFKRAAQVDFDWYPFDTLSSFHRLHQLLQGDDRDLFCNLGRSYVLDLGCGDGDCSFFLESLGCRVVAADNPPTNFNAMRGIATLKERLGSSIQIEEINLDERFAVPPRTYGLVILLGVLYHLKNPFYALEYLSRVAPYCFISTRTIEAAPDGRRLGGLPVAYLVDNAEMNNDPTNFWAFTETALARLISRSGWRVVGSVTAASELPADPVSPRADQRSYLLLKNCFPFAITGNLGSGWHDIEPDGWRWTAQTFDIEFNVPYAGGTYALAADIVIPEALLSVDGHATLRGSANGIELEPETFVSPGRSDYRRRLAPEVTGQTQSCVRFKFELSQRVKPAGTDQRELGIIVVRMDLFRE